MAPSNSCFSSVFLVLLALHFSRIHQVMSLIITPPNCKPIEATDVDRVQFALNLEFCQAEYFLYGAFGKGLDSISPNLTAGGPPPIGVQKALLLNPEVARISEEIAYQQVGNIRSIFETVGGFPRPLLNLSVTLWALLFDLALKKPLIPPFNPYRNSLSFLLAAYAMPDLAQTSYVSSISSFTTNSSSSLASKLLAIKAGQSAVIRTLLYQNATQFVPPYQITVAEFTKAISELTNILGKCGIKSEGILLDNTTLGAENRTTSNVLSADANSLSYSRTEPEILRIVYGTGNEHLPSGFFPKAHRNLFGGCGDKDEGILLPNNTLGAENPTSNILSANFNSESYARTPAEILRIVYGGNESVPGGFIPQVANGNIAKRYLDLLAS